jgi:hypothetical protein
MRTTLTRVMLVAALVAAAGCKDRGGEKGGGGPLTDSAGQASTQVADEPPVVDAPPTPAIDPDSLRAAAHEDARLPSGPPSTTPGKPSPRTYAACMEDAAKAPAEERAILESSCRNLPGAP